MELSCYKLHKGATMKVLLNYGAGVNSTAMMIKAAEQECWQGHEIHCVFSDTGCEHPETMEYIKDHAAPFCKDVGFELVIVSGYQEGTRFYPGLIDYCKQYNMIPSRRFRWCTDKLKVRPIRKYQGKFRPDIALIGIDAGEEHRANSDDPITPPRLHHDHQKCWDARTPEVRMFHLSVSTKGSVGFSTTGFP